MNARTIMMTLWDVLRVSEQKEKLIVPSRPRPIQQKYDAIVETMKETYGFRIRNGELR